MIRQQKNLFILPILAIVLAILFSGCSADCSAGCCNIAESSEATATAAATDTPSTEAPATEAPAAWCVNEDKSLSSPTGKSFHFEEAFYGAKIEIISTHKDRALIKISRQYPEYGVSVMVADDKEMKVHYLSSNEYTILDIGNAYDTVYWFTSDQEVWACHWWCMNGDCKEIYAPVLFCQGALALSPYADESEGAVVPNGKDNWPYVKGLHILSPYGEGGKFQNPEPCWD